MNFLTSRKSQDGHTYMDINTYKAGSSLHWNPISGWPGRCLCMCGIM